MGQGGAVAVKTALTADEQADLTYEVELLRRVRHLGVVQVVDGAADDELRTRYAGEPLHRWSGDLRRAATLGAAVAAVLGDLHDEGVVHGRIDGSHVLLGRDGQPRLCGFRPPGDLEPPDDVAAAAVLIGLLVDGANATDQRWPYLRRRGGVADRQALAALLQHASDPDPRRRPSARSLASSLVRTVPGAEMPTSQALGIPALTPVGDVPAVLDGPSPDPVFGDQTTAEVDEVFVDRPWEASEPDPPAAPRVPPRPGLTRPPARRRRVTVARLAVMTVVVGAVAVAAETVMTSGGRPAGDRPFEAAGAAAEASPRRCPAPTEDPSTTATLDVDGDGCEDGVHVSGGVVEVDGRRWQVGGPDDSIALGDWDCDGYATPAVYRPATGDVFVFSSWAAEGKPVTVSAVDRVVGGRSLAASDVPASGGGGCSQLAVVMGSGTRQQVEIPR